jgi:hypothetical protein
MQGTGNQQRSSERKSLVVTFSELTQEEDNREYANAEETFLNQHLIAYTMDEVHAMMQIMCCNNRLCGNCYNPLYVIIFALLFIAVLPGAASHWALLSCIPVRKREHPEERELRSQGIYAALGIAIISIPFSVLGLFIGDDEMVLVNEVSLYVNISIIASSLIGLKAIGDELVYTIRIFAVGAWVIDVFLIGLALVDAYSYLTVSWLTIVSYSIRLFTIFIYTIVAIQCLNMWNLYTPRKESEVADMIYASILGLIYLGVVAGFLVIIIISEENAWRILYF